MNYSNLSFYKIKTILLLTLSFFSFHLFGQETLIEESLKPFSELNTLENQKLTKVQSEGMYSDYYLVDFGSLAETQENGKIKISLPGDHCGDLIFKSQSVEYMGEEDYLWYGLLEPSESTTHCQLGSITLLSSEYGKTGHIIVNDLTYELLELGENQYLLAKLDGSKFTESECGVDHNTPVNNLKKEAPAESRNDGNGNCDVRLLVLYTANALALEGSVAAINNRANLAVAQTNQALDNSDVDACQLKIELAGVGALSFIEADEIRDDIEDFANDVNAQALRNAFEADMVVLLTDGEYGGIFGIVQAVGPGDATSYGIVQTGAATTGRFTFAHEVAHLFGGGHDNDPRNGIPHGHSFRTGSFFPRIFGARQRTILHRAGAEDIRIQHYSNPKVKYDGRKTGKAGKRDNANQLINEACVVAGFRETVKKFGVMITGDRYTCPCDGAHFDHWINGGTAGATYIYHWETSNDGINWTTISTAPSANVATTAPPHHCPGEDRVFIRLLVEGSDGNTDMAYATLKRFYTWPDQEEPCPMFLNGEGGEISLSVLPNPIQDEAIIMIQVHTKGTYSIAIKDVNGRTQQELIENQILEVGFHSYPLSLSQNGLYLIESIDHKGNQVVEKLLKF